jgi:hypothetical protein
MIINKKNYINYDLDLHSFNLLPQLVHVTICPHSNKTQSIVDSIHILHKFMSEISSTSEKTKIKSIETLRNFLSIN